MVLEFIKEKASAWLRLARLQFYPQSLISYSLGAAVAFRTAGRFDFTIYIVGFISVFLIEIGTVFSNELYDYPTDLQNTNAGLFTGGSRMLVMKRIEPKALKAAIFACLFLLILFGFLLVRATEETSQTRTVIMLFVGALLGYGYTVPPFKFSYRGMGEMVVALTYGPYLVFLGHGLQVSHWNIALSVAFSVPLFFAILPSIVLAGIPDRDSDLAFSKRTMAVLIGSSRTALAATIATLLAVLSWALLPFWGVGSVITKLGLVCIIAHAGILALAIINRIRSGEYDRGLDRTMWLSLSFILWFGILPLAHLLWF